MRYWYTNFPHDILKDFSKENDIVIPDAPDYDKEDLRKWVWEHVTPGTPTVAHESQALRLLRFIETGSFDESKT
jgi:hypothetical protein